MARARTIFLAAFVALVAVPGSLAAMANQRYSCSWLPVKRAWMWEPVLMLRGETVVTPDPFADHPAVLESIFISELEAPGCLGKKVTFRSSGRRRSIHHF